MNVIYKTDRIEIFDDGSIRVGSYSQPAKEPSVSRPRLLRTAPLPKWVREELTKGNVVIIKKIDVANDNNGGVYPIVRGKAVTPSVETEKKLYGVSLCFDSRAQLIKAYRQYCLVTARVISGQVIDRKEESGSELIATRDYAEFEEFRSANDVIIERTEGEPEVKTEVNYFSTSDESVFVRRETIMSTPRWTEKKVDSRYFFNEETGRIEFKAEEVEVTKIGTTTTTATITTVKVLEKKESHRSYKLGCYADTTEYVFDNGETYSSTEAFVPWVEEQTRLAQYMEDFRNGVLDD